MKYAASNGWLSVGDVVTVSSAEATDVTNGLVETPPDVDTLAVSVSPATVGLPRIDTHEVRTPRGATSGGRSDARSMPPSALATLGRPQVSPQASDER